VSVGVALTVKGRTIRLPIRYCGHYTRELRAGQTIYQHIFGKIIRGDTISVLGLTKEFETGVPNIGEATVGKMVRRVVAGMRASKDPRLKNLPVHITTRGGDRRSSSWEQRAYKTTRRLE
jgi:hypothetical protein